MSDNVAHAVAGAAGGIVSMLCTYPLITISTRAQVNSISSTPSSSSSTASTSTAEPPQQQQRQPTTLLRAFQTIVKQEGVSGLYTGLSSALFGITITNGVYYYWYELAKGWLLLLSRGKEKGARLKGGRNVALGVMESMGAGALAGSATAVVTNPIWVVNTRMTANKDSLDTSPPSSPSNRPSSTEQRQPKPRKTAVQTFLNILAQDGPQALFQGIVPALILVINPIIQYTAFEACKARLLKRRGGGVGEGKGLSGLDFFVLGAASKLVATFMTYPYIVIKSRMQLRPSRTDPRIQYHSVTDGLRKIIANEGVAGLYKGVSSKLLQSMLTAAILFAAKEELYRVAVWALRASRGLKRKEVVKG